MATSNTSGVGNASSATGMFTNNATGGSALDKDAFLLLLVTQFKHQDPLNPMEDREFIAQLAQFTSLEQQMSTNEQMGKLLESQLEQQAISAVNYLGKEVSARGWGVSTDGKGNTTKIDFIVTENMSKGYVNIFDAGDNLVNTVALDAYAPGVHTFEWDGKISDESMAPKGVYTMQFAAFDANGQNLVVDASVSGTVTGITRYEGQQILTLSDGRMVALTNVRAVETPKAVEPPKPDDGKDDETTPPAEDETTPPAEGETTPPAEGETTPPAEGGTTPPATGGTDSPLSRVRNFLNQ